MPKGDYKRRIVCEATANLHKRKEVLTADAIKNEANAMMHDTACPYFRRKVTDISSYQIDRILLKTKCAKKKGQIQVSREYGKVWVNEYEYIPPEQRGV